MATSAVPLFTMVGRAMSSPRTSELLGCLHLYFSWWEKQHEFTAQGLWNCSAACATADWQREAAQQTAQGPTPNGHALSVEKAHLKGTLFRLS